MRPQAVPPPLQQMQTLVDAILTVGADLDISHILGRVVRSASALADARYAVLSLATPDRRITDFHVHGISAEQRRKIGPLPQLRGVLGRVFLSRQPLRVANVAAHPAAVGFPPHHPRITSLLAVPIAMRDKTYGQLYLGNKRGSREFSQDDEDAILALATAAGIAIQNARLFEQERRRQQWLEAASELTHLLLGEVSRDVALRTVTQRLRQVSGADYGGMLLVNPTDSAVVDLEAVEGPGIEQTSGSRAPLQGLTARVVKTGRGVVSEDLLQVEGANPPPEWHEAVSAMGLGMLLPLIAPGEILGVLFAGWRRGSPHERVAAGEVPLVEMFASQAALALQQVRAQQNRSRLLVLEDRDRIAHDLHDAVIQRLFAIGTRLHSAAGLTSRPDVRRRVTAAIEELDQTTEDVRSAIFQLHDKGGTEGSPTVRDRLLSEVDNARGLFGFTPRFVLHGTMEAIPALLHTELLAAVPDALAVIAGQVSGSSVEVVLRVDPDMVSLLVTATGPRTTPAGPGMDSGISADLADRARRLGGSCTTRVLEVGATVISWQVPIRSL